MYKMFNKLTVVPILRFNLYYIFYLL